MCLAPHCVILAITMRVVAAMKATVSFTIPSLTLYPSEDDISPLYGSPFVGSVFLGVTFPVGLYACLIVWPGPGAPSSPTSFGECFSFT